MPYRFLEETAISDVAFEAEGKTLGELFESAALAVTGTMVQDAEKIDRIEIRNFEVEAESIEMLLFNFLQELIFLKDTEMLLFSKFELGIDQRGGNWHLIASAGGEKIDPERHELIVDVKAVSLHNYRVEETPQGWRAEVILDV